MAVGKEEVEAAGFDSSLEKFGSEGKEGAEAKAKGENWVQGGPPDDEKKTSTFLGREERASRSRSLGCKHITS